MRHRDALHEGSLVPVHGRSMHLYVTLYSPEQKLLS